MNIHEIENVAEWYEAFAPGDYAIEDIPAILTFSKLMKTAPARFEKGISCIDFQTETAVREAIDKEVKIRLINRSMTAYDVLMQIRQMIEKVPGLENPAEYEILSDALNAMGGNLKKKARAEALNEIAEFIENKWKD